MHFPLGTNDPRGGAIFDLRDMNGWIYVHVEFIITLFHIKHTSFGSCGFREEEFSFISINEPTVDTHTAGRGLNGPHEHD